MNEFIEIPASEKSLSNRRLVFGKGSNDATYMTQTTFNGRSSICPYYSRWRDLLKRCYSDKFQNKNTSYIGCSVASEWIKFSNFKSWMEKQDWEGKELDKDLLVQGNKVYGPSTCIFVPREINLIVKNSVKKNSELPVGVSYHAKSKNYRAYTSFNGRYKGLGEFSSVELASKAYKVEKYRIIKAIAAEQLEPLRSALLSWDLDLVN